MRDISCIRIHRSISYPLIACTLTLILFFSIRIPAAAKESTPNILILDSYHQGEDWSDNEIDGIRSAFNKVYPFLIPSIEHMDTKRFPNPTHLLFVRNYLENKYREKQFDIIITLDNPALNLMLRYGDELFPKVPVLFAGVNGYCPDMLEGHTNITGIAEVQNMGGTLRLALKINPEIKTVLAVHDYTSSGFAVRRDMESIAEKFKNQVTVEYAPEGTVDDLMAQLKALPEDTIVLLLTYVTDKKGRTLTREESTRLITSASPVPVYAMHETRLGYGIVGGMLLEGREHGRQAAAQALRILAGEEISQISVENSSSRPVFDLNVLGRFDIKEKLLPTDSVIINRPASFWREYQTIWIAGLVIMGVLVISTLLLGKTVMKMQVAEKALRKSEERFLLAMKASNDGVFDWNLETNHIYYSPAWKNMLGYEDHELPNDFSIWEKTTDPEDVQKSWELQQKLISKQIDRFMLEFKMKHKDGHWVDILSRAKAIFNDSGKAVRMVGTHVDITERKRAEEELRRYEWIIEKEMPWADTTDSGFESAYGDVTKYNRKRLILDGVKKENLEQMAADVMALLDTSLAVYEANGDYAYGIFKSSWCQNLDTAAFNLSGTNDVKKALACGKWLCHDNCWNDSAKAAIASGKPVDIECVGGIRLYAVPVFAGNEIIGVVNIGYGNPPKDHETLIKLSEKFNISLDLLRAKADAYKPRPNFIVELGKKRCEHMARMIGGIIESRQAEKALMEKEALFRGLFDHMTSGSAVYEVRNDGSKGSDYIIREFNRKSLEMEGKTPDEVIGRSLFDLRPNIEAYELIPVMKKVWETGISAYFPTKIYQDGRFSNYYENHIFKLPSGELVTLYNDVTDEKNQERELQESERKYRVLFDTFPLGITVTDQSGKIVESNTISEKLLGIAKTEHETRTIYEPKWQIIRPDGTPMPAAELASVRALKEKRQIENVEMGIVKSHGEITWINVSAAPLSLEKYGVAVIYGDITERKQAEAEKEKLQAQLLQAQKMESVGRLAGGVAHDFNNMLGVILGHAELALERAEENNEICSDLKEIQTAAQRSADLTKQLLTFARKQIIEPKMLNLNRTVKQMITMLQRLIGEDIDLLWKPAKNLWSVKMDPSQIDQILANLLVNARDAITNVGKITIETGMVGFDEIYCAENAGFIPGDFVLLGVSDNGSGMDKEVLNNLFEPFFTTKEMGKGTGLGLATVYGIIKQNNGFINVYSEPGQGSTFKIYLPRFVADEETDKALPDKKATAGGTETILLVEDEPSILRMTRMMLERKGYTVLSAATPTEAMEKVKSHSGTIALLMTDVVLPEMNGRDLAEQITNLYPDIRLLFISGYTANVIAHQGILDDGVAFLQKPFSMGDLAEKLREVLDAAPDKNRG